METVCWQLNTARAVVDADPLCQKIVVRTNWAMEKTVAAHLSRIQGHLDTGRKLLRSLRTDELTAYDIPNVVPDLTVTQSQPPLDTDKLRFYLVL